MKIYNLTIAFNEETEEIEYIEESLEGETMTNDLLLKLTEEGLKDSVSMSIIEQLEDVAKA